ncbi:hypothetical protein SASPL_120084 [Salvia splendens]|uniref:ArsA/GET3 Anion-transporting ATPase-like domain-containing protein n=1 Tax=Salvia splendens TaxID=180675 RepID=A0A8X8ZTN2_SALSN|nr:hypothetical protein SASPL_120084 [Salvia splendens]
MASLFTHMSKSLPHKHSSAKLSRSIQHLVSAYINSNPLTPSFQARYMTTAMTKVAGFDEMVSSNQRKFYLLGGKGGVGKTSCAASLAVKLANQGHPTIVVSTDPAHSLSDSFDQNLTGGMLVPVQGVDSPLYALELNPEKAREELSSKGQHDEGAVRNVMDSMGLGGFAGMMGDLKLDELLETSPPGLDEIVMKFLDSPEYSEFRRIVFDTAPTGHTLRLLSLPDFLDASIGKMMKIKKKIASATAALKSAFGKGEPQQDDVSKSNDKLEQLRLSMGRVRDLFRDPETTEFVIVMAVNESSRLCASLRKEMVPVNRLVVNQLLPPSASDCKFCSMRKTDQRRALDKIKKDPELAKLKLIESPLVDVEIRGVPALKFMGDMVWR